jgi:hypothetical protein
MISRFTNTRRAAAVPGGRCGAVDGGRCYLVRAAMAGYGSRDVDFFVIPDKRRPGRWIGHLR